MIETKVNAVSVVELFSNTFEILRDRHSAIEISADVGSEVGDDSDGHRHRKGYMIYTKSMTLRFEGKTSSKWILALGTKTSGYPAEAFECDITAIPLTTQLPSTPAGANLFISEAIQGSTYFKHSLLVGMSGSGLIATKDENIKKLLLPVIPGAMTEEPVVDPEVVHCDLRPVYSVSAKYRPEFAEKLAEAIELRLTQD